MGEIKRGRKQLPDGEKRKPISITLDPIALKFIRAEVEGKRARNASQLINAVLHAHIKKDHIK